VASSALGHPYAESSPPSREQVWQPPRSWWGGGSPNLVLTHNPTTREFSSPES
jgi:hypothetical protein